MSNHTPNIAIYCRYSTEYQDPSSIDDQTRLCEKLIQNIPLTGSHAVYEDRAISGASRVNRPSFTRMIADLNAGKISAIIAENVSRLSRDVEDAAHLLKIANYRSVPIYCVSDGSVPLTNLNMHLNAFVSEQGRLQNAQMVHRGMLGVVSNGKSAGGLTYGYRSKPRRAQDRGGELETCHSEAEIVREIFQRYIAGESPRSIAKDLNERKVPSPRAFIDRKGRLPSGEWRDSTIIGNKNRGSGILWNPLYNGIRRWNRSKMVKDPSTARRHSRPNAKCDWVDIPVPELGSGPIDMR